MEITHTLAADTSAPAMVRPVFASLSSTKAVLLAIAASLAYWFAFSTSRGTPAILIALPCLCILGRVRTSRQAFYGGMLVGIGMYVPHLLFFWSIFHRAAIPLWLVAGMPVAIFLLLSHLMHRRFGTGWALALTPIVWTGLEYFRSELYYLRFAWLLTGQAPAFLPGVRMLRLGVYGLGFLYITASVLAVAPRRILRVAGVLASVSLAMAMFVPNLPPTPSPGALRVVGVQLESADERVVVEALDQLATAHPDAQILVLSEYSFYGPVPASVRKVLKRHRRYLVAGGVETLTNGYYNTAFVVGPDGKDIFSQAKSVPVQFMTDGMPAPQRRVWDSPWGKIGIAVCYDLSYARVMDDFVRQGAQGLIIPTMDLSSWGEYERRMLHGRMAPVRSAEYGIPTFGVWSSGESQLTDRFGRIIAVAGYPGQGDTIAGPFNLSHAGRVPPDRILATSASAATGIIVAALAALHIAGWVSRRKTRPRLTTQREGSLPACVGALFAKAIRRAIFSSVYDRHSR